MSAAGTVAVAAASASMAWMSAAWTPGSSTVITGTPVAVKRDTVIGQGGLVGEDQGRGAVSQDVVDPVRRVVRIDRDVGGTGAHHRSQHHRQIAAPSGHGHWSLQVLTQTRGQ